MRPESLYPLFAGLDKFRGIGPKLRPLVVRAVGGDRVRDLLYLCPQSFLERSVMSLKAAQDGKIGIFNVVFDQHVPPNRPGQPWRLRVIDETGFGFICWFKGYGKHFLQLYPKGERRVVSGKVERFGIEVEILHPDYVLQYNRKDDIALIEAVYPTTAGLASRLLRKFIQQALQYLPDLEEWQDQAWLDKKRLLRQAWPSWREAFYELHNPKCQEDLLPQARARQRLAFDELLAHQIVMVRRKMAYKKQPSPPIEQAAISDRIILSLPFELTSAQKQVLDEIKADLGQGFRMNRLIQGDVGSGKTVIAMLVMVQLAAAGFQTVLMAPTEILARQHYKTFQNILGHFGYEDLFGSSHNHQTQTEAGEGGDFMLSPFAPVIFTGRDKGRLRKEKLEQLASGHAKIIIGTHALFQDDVVFQNLGLAVIDEQHRFGVAERKRLITKGTCVHLLTLSATPIPRTLELSLYGDLDLSRILEKPPGRKPVKTKILSLERLDLVMERLSRATENGAQAFWICPLVSESERLDIQAAETRAEILRERLPQSVGLVHGRMAASDKDQVMTAFAQGAISVLVATTVIEVGVDVPNATIMVIEHAERFGLSQLHQLRGRVGRGQEEGSCLLLYAPPLSDIGYARLKILEETEDGFLIAEKDLSLRGAGDLVGLKQTGLPNYRFADPFIHSDLLRAAADDARLILAQDPKLVGERGQKLRTLIGLFDWRLDDFLIEAG